MKALFSILFVIVSFFGYSQNLRLNEMVTSNSEYLDEDGDTPDWIELYNNSSSSIDLSGWSLSDDILQPSMWVFPEIAIAEDDYILLWASDKDRYENTYPNSIITEEDVWNYVLPNANVTDEWRDLDYDDSNWSSGPSGIGYSDDDDNTLINNNADVLYARKTFNIADVSDVLELILHIDYDDGFVAYINGIEIARANITLTNPTYNSFANNAREAIMYQGDAPERFDIDDFDDLLLNGENVLAIQIHNNIATSSDMSFIPFLTTIQKSPSTALPIDLLDLRPTLFHTNFKLNSIEETVYLFDANQNLIDSLQSSNLPINVSTGIDDNENIALFQNTTPGSQNSNPIDGIISESIIFSINGGPCIGCISFPLTLSGNPPDSEIRYTLDMTIPNAASPLYTTPLTINSTQVVRARIFKNNFIPSRTQTEAYLLEAQHSLPVVSLVTDPENFFNQDSGIYVLGDNYENNLPFFGANFWQEWERDIHFSIYEADGLNSYSFDGGTKIFGGWSRANDQKSLSLFARKQYGFSEIDYPLFDTRPFTSYQSFVLRNSGNDFLSSNLRDGTLTSILDYRRLETTAYKPTATYVNGEYWGIMNLREKVNEHFLASRYNLDPDKIDLVELNAEAIHGSADGYIELRNSIANTNLNDNQNYLDVTADMDIDNFILYNIMQIYINNTDWPGNNIKFWKSDQTKWRWIFFDTDFGFGRWNPNDFGNNTLDFALTSNGPSWPNPPWSTLLLRRLMINQIFKHKFINQFADEMNSTLLPSRISDLIDQNATLIESEIPDHFNRWNGNPGSWNTTINDMKTFGIRRPTFVKDHILSRFNLPNYHRIRIVNDQLNQGYVILNSLTIDDDSTWSGDYFEEVPILLTAIPRLGYRFSHWEGAINTTDPALSINMKEGMVLFPIFEEDPFNGTPVVINEINYNSNEDFDTDDWIELHNHTDNTIDLSGWKLKDDNDEHVYIFPDLSLFESKHFLVLTKDQVKFENLVPDAENIFGNLDFGFSNGEDMVRLYNSEDVLIDSVAYSSDAPWSTEANGEGPTLELLHPSLDNTLPENWARLHDTGSPEASNLDNSATQKIDENLEFLIYPNPFNNQISISFNAEESIEELYIELYNTHGALIRLLYSNDRENKSAFNKQLDITGLVAGIYIVKIKINGKSHMRLINKM